MKYKVALYSCQDLDGRNIAASIQPNYRKFRRKSGMINFIKSVIGAESRCVNIDKYITNYGTSISKDRQKLVVSVKLVDNEKIPKDTSFNLLVLYCEEGSKHDCNLRFIPKYARVMPRGGFCISDEVHLTSINVALSDDSIKAMLEEDRDTKHE